jgi:hypothetical protein
MVELICGELGGPCPVCGAAIDLHVTEGVDGGRVVWTATSRCPACGYTDESTAPPAFFDNHESIVRQTLVARVGLARVRIDPENRDQRLRSLAVLRRRGATIAEVAESYAALTGPGLVGTPAETSLLAEELSAEGVRAAVGAEAADASSGPATGAG